MSPIDRKMNWVGHQTSTAASAVSCPQRLNDPKLSDGGGLARRLRKSGWGRRRWEQPA